MGYIRAEDVLPSEVLTLVQEFIDGQTLYVPKKDAARNTWGSVSGAREYLAYRNAQIRIEYRAGREILPFREEHPADHQRFQPSEVKFETQEVP